MGANNTAATTSSGHPGRGDNILQNEDFNRRWEAAFKRVLTTVAVAVVARRLVFKSLV